MVSYCYFCSVEWSLMGFNVFFSWFFNGISMGSD